MNRPLLSLFLAISLAATLAGPLAAEEEPQLAYRILSGYFDKQAEEGERGRKGGGTVLASIGGTLLAGAGVTYFAGDYIGESLFGGPMDPEIKNNVSLGLGIGGLATTAVGVGLLTAKPRDPTVEYAEVFAENDSQVREALAVAALKDLSIKGKKRRMTSAVSNLAVPVAYALVKAGMNAAEGKAWNDNIFSGFYWGVWNVSSGLTSLFGTTEEERLYEKYLAGREALYGDR